VDGYGGILREIGKRTRDTDILQESGLLHRQALKVGLGHSSKSRQSIA